MIVDDETKKEAFNILLKVMLHLILFLTGQIIELIKSKNAKASAQIQSTPQKEAVDHVGAGSPAPIISQKRGR